MKRIIFAIALVVALVIVLEFTFTNRGMSQSNPTNEAAHLADKGQFKEAAAVLKTAIDSGKLSPADKKSAELQLDIHHRIREDYTTSADGLFGDLKQEIKGLTREEFDGWVKAGWFDTREIDGKLFFFDSSFENLWFRHPELVARRNNPPNKSVRERKALEVARAITKASAAEHSPYVLPKTFDVTMHVTANADAVPDGEIIRTWMPIPRKYPFQDSFKLMSSSLPPKIINPEDSPIRAIYFEQPAKKGKPTECKIEYEYRMYGVHFELNPDKIQPYKPNDEAVKDFTKESPHIVFTPELKALSAKIVGNETNPMLKAKRIYDYLSDTLQYSYATEYSTIPNISDYTRAHCYGDCGEQGMLFMALCRYNGVPARWQSGWNLFPNDTSNHDWSEIYLAPYGWVPVDQYMGNYAMRYIKSLSPEEKKEVRDFYFGGLDQYRLIANSDHSIALSPAKQWPRSDDVDFQRGEVETAKRNLYLGEFSYRLHYKEIAAPALP
jgi:transglutaminase-like putative cysteine protease